MQTIQAAFTEGLKNYLDFQETPYHIVIKAKHYIKPKQDFNQILNIIHTFGGQYLSEGKNSRFEIPKNNKNKTDTQ
jgi:hypothetical protein